MIKSMMAVAVFVLLAGLVLADTAPQYRAAIPEGNIAPDSVQQYPQPTPQPEPTPEVETHSGGGRRHRNVELVQSEPPMPVLLKRLDGWQCWEEWGICFRVLS